MRAYVAIVKDAFREALVSKVLWVLLVLATLFLLAIAPISLVERGPTAFDWNDLRDANGLAREINRQAQVDKPSPGKRILQIDAETPKQESTSSLNASPTPIASEKATPSGPPKTENATSDSKKPVFPNGGNVFASLNAVVKERKFYDAAAWADVKLGDEAQTLIDRGIDNLDDKEAARLNRLLIEAAFSRYLRVSSTRPYLGYAWFEMDSPLSMDMNIVMARALSTFTNYFLGGIGVFAAILVTSSFIPRTFETGTVDLLLSKPVARPFVYLAKFFGGCAFITLISAYLIVGMWLVAGLRIGYWNHRFLWCVPLMLFIFAIYFSVSALAGVVWRNAIVAVVMAMLFWLLCFALNVTKNFVFDQQLLSTNRINELIAGGDEVFSIHGSMFNPRASVHRWDADARTWQDVFTQGQDGNLHAGGIFMFQERFSAGPIYDPVRKKLFAVGRMGEGKGGASNEPWLFMASAEGQWREQVLAKTVDVRSLVLRGDGRLIGLSSDGIVDLPADATPLSEKQLADPKLLDAPPGVKVSQVDSWSLPEAAAAIPGARSNSIVTYDSGKLRLLAPDDKGNYKPLATADVEPQASAAAGALTTGGGFVVLGLKDGRLISYATDGKTLKLISSQTPRSDVAVARVSAADEGFDVLYEDHRVWRCRGIPSAQEVTQLHAWVQGDIAAIARGADDTLICAHAFNHLTRFEASSDRVVEKLSPEYSGVEAVYWYGIYPAYMVLPKPGDLDNLTTYLLEGKSTVAVDDRPNAPTVQLDIVTPVWSNLAFLAVMLGLGCWYVARKDF